MTTRTSGVFEEGTAPPLTSPSIVMPAMDFVVQWNRCGITADYLADYLSYAFERRDVARSVITTAANELLENAAKFSSDKKAPVRIAARLRGNFLDLEVENVADADHVDTLTTVLEALSRGEAASLFASRIESAERGGLGLIILVRDYDAQLGARIVSVNGGSLDTTYSVTVRASIAADEVEQQ
jgi:hypothetical protein